MATKIISITTNVIDWSNNPVMKSLVAKDRVRAEKVWKKYLESIKKNNRQQPVIQNN